MNQTFQINRFLRFLGKELYEQRKFLIYSTIVILCLLSFISWLIFFNARIEPNTLEHKIEYYADTYIGFYLIGFCIVGGIIQSIAFSDIHKKKKGTYYLMQPVSTLEKFFSKIFIHVLLFYVIYTILFLGVKYFTDMFIIKLPVHIPLFPFPNTLRVLFYFAVIFIFHGVYLAGSVTFRKLNTLICTILLGIFLIIGNFFLGGLSHFISPYMQNILFIANGNIVYANTDVPNAANLIYYAVNVENNTFTGLLRIIELFSIFPLLWIYTWFKFKEKQV